MNENSSGDSIIARIQESLDPRVMHLIVLPTEHCNFRCTYCYEDFAIGAMPESKVRGLLAFVNRLFESRSFVRISWFGGEPLLALRTVVEVSSFAKRKATEAGATFESNVTTNGYGLDVTTMEQLLEAGVTRFQVTLDGDRQTHDSRRRRINGRGTFEKIWRNLRELRTSVRLHGKSFHVMIRVHYDHESISALPEFTDSLTENFGGDGRFSVHFHALERLGGPGDLEMRLPTVADHSFVRALTRDKLDSAGLHMTHYQDAAGHICYASKANSLLIRANGRIGKCTVALGDPQNDIGIMNDDGTLELSDEKLKPWLRGIFNGDADALACPQGNMGNWAPIQAPVSISTARLR